MNTTYKIEKNFLRIIIISSLLILLYRCASAQKTRNDIKIDYWTQEIKGLDNLLIDIKKGVEVIESERKTAIDSLAFYQEQKRKEEEHFPDPTEEEDSPPDGIAPQYRHYDIGNKLGQTLLHDIIKGQPPQGKPDEPVRFEPQTKYDNLYTGAREKTAYDHIGSLFRGEEFLEYEPSENERKRLTLWAEGRKIFMAKWESVPIWVDEESKQRPMRVHLSNAGMRNYKLNPETYPDKVRYKSVEYWNRFRQYVVIDSVSSSVRPAMLSMSLRSFFDATPISPNYDQVEPWIKSDNMKPIIAITYASNGIPTDLYYQLWDVMSRDYRERQGSFLHIFEDIYHKGEKVESELRLGDPFK